MEIYKSLTKKNLRLLIRTQTELKTYDYLFAHKRKKKTTILVLVQKSLLHRLPVFH